MATTMCDGVNFDQYCEVVGVSISLKLNNEAAGAVRNFLEE